MQLATQPKISVVHLPYFPYRLLWITPNRLNLSLALLSRWLGWSTSKRNLFRKNFHLISLSDTQSKSPPKYIRFVSLLSLSSPIIMPAFAFFCPAILCLQVTTTTTTKNNNSHKMRSKHGIDRITEWKGRILRNAS